MTTLCIHSGTSTACTERSRSACS